ncbi:MAG: hypothetical protein GF311_11210 [Candidatus Lokiarchaeota archaeon]|nr:hypothetical protein [Candidatus Lokiarchaeota archaeon]
MENNNRFFLLDTDIGSDIDDAMALLLYLRLENVSLVGITTMYSIAALRAKIAKKMLRLANEDIPVAIGRDKTIDKRGYMWKTGLEGFGVLSEEEFHMAPDEMGIIENGIDFIIDKANQYTGKLEIISIGQFTNIAAAIQKDPRFKDHIKRIWSMSAGVTFLDPIPENFPEPNEKYHAIPSHNIRSDVEAAKVVLDSDIPITFIGNDVTTQVVLFDEDIELLRDYYSGLNKAITDMMDIWLTYRSRRLDREINFTCLHDALTVAEALGKDFTQKVPIDIDIEESGASIISYKPNSLYNIAWQVEAESFMNWYLEHILV